VLEEEFLEVAELAGEGNGESRALEVGGEALGELRIDAGAGRAFGGERATQKGMCSQVNRYVSTPLLRCWAAGETKGLAKNKATVAAAVRVGVSNRIGRADQNSG